MIRNRWHKILLLTLVFAMTCPLWAQSREKDYVRQDSARFRIWYCPEDAKVVRDLWSELRARIPLVESQLRLGLSDTVTFVIAPEEREWSRLTAGAPLWANGITYSQHGVAILKSPRFGLPYGPLPTTAIHEYVHLLLESGARSVDIPRWLNEGLAQVLAGQLNYVDDAVLARAAAARRLHSFWRIEGLMGMDALEARQAYAESAVAVQLLQSRYGMAGIANLVHALRGGSSYEETFRTIFGLSPGAFESDYQTHVRDNFRISFFGDTELWASLAFVLLVGAAGLGVWLRRRRTMRRWREEDAQARGISAGESSTMPTYTVNYTIVRGRLHESDDDSPPEESLPDDKPPMGK